MPHVPAADGRDGGGEPGLFGFEGKTAPDGTPLSQLPDLSSESPELVPYLLPFQRVISVRDLPPLPGPGPGTAALPLPGSSPGSLTRTLRLTRCAGKRRTAF